MPKMVHLDDAPCGLSNLSEALIDSLTIIFSECPDFRTPFEKVDKANGFRNCKTSLC